MFSQSPRRPRPDAPRRRSRAGAALALGALTVASVPISAGAQDAPPAAAPAATRGQAIAEVLQIDPAIASLALTISMGTAIAGHQNGGSSSEAYSLDFGIIGDLLTAQGCDGGEPTIARDSLPESLAVNSSDPSAAEGATGGIDNVALLSARADNTPTSSAGADVLPVGIPGVIEIQGGRSTTSSSGVDGTATATTEIGSVRLLDGLVRIDGLTWNATRTLGAQDTATTEFDLGSIVIGGTPIALPDGIDAVAELLEPLLATLGFALDFPEAFPIPDGIGLSPLTVGIIPAEARDSVLGGLLGALTPIRTPLNEQLLEIDCGNATYLTVLDVVLGSISGAGSLTVNLGGVQAAVAPIELSSFLQPLPTPGGSLADAGTPSVGLGGSGTPTAPVTQNLPRLDTAAPAPTPTGGTATQTPIQSVAAIQEGERGGPLLYVGLIGLAGIGIAAVLERFKMRRGQRSGPMPLA